jgi:TP901 family phage tail tape measure protein
MVRRLGIELVASAEQARQVLRAFSRDLGVLEAQSNATEKALNRAALGRFPGSGFNQVGGGQNLTKSNQQLLSLGNTFKVVTDLSLKLASGQEVLYSKTTGYTGDVQRFIAAQQNYNQVLGVAQTETATYTRGIETLTRAHDQLIARQRQVAAFAQAGITTAQSRITNANASTAAPRAARDVASQRLVQAQSLAAFVRNGYAAGDFTLERLNRVNAIVAQRQIALTAAQAALTQATQAAARERGQATSQLARSQATEARAQAAIITAENQYTNTVRTRTASLRARLDPRLNAAEQRIINAVNAPSPLPPVFQQLSQPANRGGSPQLLRQLQRSGLNLNNLGAQGAQESFSLEKDLVRNVTRVNGAFLDQNNVLNRVSAEFDKGGRVITRFGGQMSGLGNVLSQISRDFQKVIEFAVATTVVFGALRYAIEELHTIVEIDKSLRQFSITANLTREETKGLFEGLSDVAITTATPLKDVVKAADDIALATRKAGQSTKEWQVDILSLTNSVGILTNLAGIDTVKATDLLVSSMKQLNLTADDLPSILSKITAVAGGQSAAIADIIQGLGVMAEAGKQGGLSVDQMIAAVQTLSQVTSKSPAEVATAFKNLVGSLASPGSIKQLEKYDIKLRDTQGNLRNILDIYGEISTKIKSGVIPQADVQALVRGISGGPRRAPDAAALLGAIDTIAQTTTKSVNATNEALIANAKILDTAQAKFTQLQVRVDKFAVTKFSDVLNETLGALVDILGKVLTLVEKIPAGFYVAILQFGLMALAVKSLAAVAKFLLAPFQSFYTQLKALTPAMSQATTGMNNLARARAGVNGAGVGAGLKGSLGALKGPAALGGLSAALTLAGGGSPLDAISSGLESAGIAGIIALPGPLKLVGAAALAAGAGIQFFSQKVQDSSEATSNAGKDAEQILNIYTRIKEATDTLSTTKGNQSALEESMAKLKENTHKSAEDLANLSTQQKQYTDNILIMADATNQLSEAQKNLADVAPGFAQALLLLREGKLLMRTYNVKLMLFNLLYYRVPILIFRTLVFNLR